MVLGRAGRWSRTAIGRRSGNWTCLERGSKLHPALASSAPLRTSEAAFSDPDAFLFPAASTSLCMGCYLGGVRRLTTQAGRITQDSTAGGLRGAGAQGNKGCGPGPFCSPRTHGSRGRTRRCREREHEAVRPDEDAEGLTDPSPGAAGQPVPPLSSGRTWQPLCPCSMHGTPGRGANREHTAVGEGVQQLLTAGTNAPSFLICPGSCP